MLRKPMRRCLTAAMVAMPIALANLVAFMASGCWGYVADVFGRRWAMIILYRLKSGGF